MSAETAAALEQIPSVDIDPSGRFKYVLIKLRQNGHEKFIVRGHSWAEYHADILDKFESTCAKAIEVECVGGGRILHEPEKQEILVYGYSQGFGRADHKISVSLLKKHYPGYTSISFSNEGY